MNPSHVPLEYYLILSGLLFSIGAAGVFLRRNLITLLLSVEIMLNAANLAFVAFGWKVLLPLSTVTLMATAAGVIYFGL